MVISLRSLNITRREAILTNGMRVIVYERPGMPVYMEAVTDSGARHDPLGKEGLPISRSTCWFQVPKNIPPKKISINMFR